MLSEHLQDTIIILSECRLKSVKQLALFERSEFASCRILAKNELLELFVSEP